eukprot:5990516-Prorocentrum_lima.AAC.1
MVSRERDAAALNKFAPTLDCRQLGDRGTAEPLCKRIGMRSDFWVLGRSWRIVSHLLRLPPMPTAR